MRDKCVEMSDNANKMRDRLIELLQKRSCFYNKSKCNSRCSNCDYVTIDDNDIGKLADHILANIVVVLPYEEGQLVYVLRSKTLNGKNLYLKKEIISHYRIFKDRAYMVFESGGLSVCDNLWKETVFLTEEEAERALKGGE